MRDHARIEFSTPDVDAEERFLREYAAEAVARLEDDPACDRFVYIRVGNGPGIDGGLVVVDVYGDPDAVIEDERETWASLVEEGPLTGWEVTDVDVPAALAEHVGERGAEAMERSRYLASRMSPLAFETFDEPPAPADEYPGEPGETGWWMVLHILSNHQGYGLDEEIDAYQQGIYNDLKNLAGGHSPARATGRIDELIADLEATRDEIEAGDYPEVRREDDGDEGVSDGDGGDGDGGDGSGE